MNGANILNELASGLASRIAGLFDLMFGPVMNLSIIGPITVSDLCVTACFVVLFFILHAVAAFLVRRCDRKAQADAKHLKHNFFGALGKPLYVLIWIFGVYLALVPLLSHFPAKDSQTIGDLFGGLFDIGLFAVLLWFFFRFTRVLETHLATWAARTGTKLDDLLVPLIGRSLRIFTPVLGIIFALPLLRLPAEYAYMVGKAVGILLIGAVALILCQVVNLGEEFLLTKYDIKAADNLQARKLYTQVHVLSRTLYFIITLFAVASMLMLFEEVRRLGTSMLASAGVVGVVLGFAAQKTIANLLAGFQIAMAQPIRLDDVVIVEGEWGRIQEITLTYVIVHIWDDRRLVVPLSYFIERPFQNWTRATAQLLGSVFVYVDYTFPVEEGRKALKEIVESHPLWDKRFWNLQVSDSDAKTMQLRVLATAADAPQAWNLRCAIREQFIAFIQKNYPQCLPRMRAEVESPLARAEAQKLPRAT